MDTEQRTRKNDSIDATQDATFIIQTKRKYKKIEKQDIKPKEEKGIVDKTENCSTDDESGDGQSTRSKDDVDREVTFDEDSEKEIDTIEIEEEDWIKYIKSSTVESVKYLGQRISFHQQETLEIKSRIRAAWATFHKYRQELTSKNYMLKHRLRLFDATVSPTLCYAAGTWTPNREHERMIQSTQRKMLRLIIQTKRRYKKFEKQEFRTNELLKKQTSTKCVALMMTAVTD